MKKRKFEMKKEICRGIWYSVRVLLQFDNKHGVTCTFHSNISPCVNLKNGRFSDYETEVLSFTEKTLKFVRKPVCKTKYNKPII